MHSHALSQIADMQDACTGESPAVCRAIILAYYPHLSQNYVKRHLVAILALPPEGIASTIGYPDPTGERAVRNVLEAVAA